MLDFYFNIYMIRCGNWKDSAGKLHNLGKGFFLRLAAAAVRDVNAQRNAYLMRYARKAMIMTVMSLNTNGRWEESQLTPKLQEIINKHRAIIDEESVINVTSGSDDFTNER